MGMKKERGRFTIKFNENDPAHDMVIRILEKQGPHSKAPFIANAILHYINCPETPDISMLQAVDRASIETIVIEILKQQGIKKQKVEEKPVIQIKLKDSSAETVQTIDTKFDTQQMNDEMLALIASTMSAFRND